MAKETTTTLLLEGKEGEFEVFVTAEVSPRENVAQIGYELSNGKQTSPEELSKICIKTSAKQIEVLAVDALREQAAADYEMYFGDSVWED